MKSVGIFGSCESGSLSMRKDIIDGLSKNGIEFFDCYKENWDPLIDGPNEAKHLVEDDIILYPISSSSFAFISLAEIGFAVTNVITRDARLIVMIQDLDDSTKWDIRRKPSEDTRFLVKSHMEKIGPKTEGKVFLVNTIDEMIQKTIDLMDD